MHLRSKFLVVALLGTGLVASTAQAATVNYVLDLSVANAFTLTAQASLGDNGGITTYGIPLVGNLTTLDHRSGNIVVSGNFQPAGFSNIRSPAPVDGGAAVNPTITAGQSLATPNLVYGFGQEASSFVAKGFGSVGQPDATSDLSWLAPMVIATGTYNRSLGTVAFGSGVTLLANVFDNGTGNERIAAQVTTQVIPFIVIGGVGAVPLDPNSYASLGTLSVTSGTLTFDTDAVSVTGGGGGLTSTTGVIHHQTSGPTIAVFDFSNVTIGGAVSVQVTGSRPLAILSRDDILIDAAITVSGANGVSGSAGANGNNGNPGEFGNNDGNSGGAGGPAPSGVAPGGAGGNGGYSSANGEAGMAGSGGTAGGFGGGGGRGDPGGNGANGANGAGGSAGANAPTVSAADPPVLTGGSAGAAGTAGANGSGGGGGGGGGGQDVTLGFDGKGSGGGSGGAGGGGGNPGSGGAGGRGIEIGAIGDVTLSSFVISRGGNGGVVGGNGGNGGAGAPGGAGTSEIGAGGHGGHGGNGGAGGQGGAGAGGFIYLHGDTISTPGANAGGGMRSGIGDFGGDGVLRMDGNTILDITGTTAGSFDTVQVVGQFRIGGGVRFEFATEPLANGFETEFTLDDFFTLNGAPVPDLTQFLALSYSAVSPGRTFDVSLNPDRTFSLMTETLEGDFNFNGVVDAADYVVWRKGLGTTHTQNDYNVWRANFGQTAGSGAGVSTNAAVPEPTKMVLLMFAATGWCLQRCRAA